MKWQRRILEVLVVLAIVAGAVQLLEQGRHSRGSSTPVPAEATSTPEFSARGVRLGTSEDEVVKLLGPSKGERFNENRQRYLNFGDVDLMFDGKVVSVIYTARVDFGVQKFVVAGSQQREIRAQLGEPFVPGPEPGPHRAPDYEFYRGRGCLLEITYKGDEATLFSIFPNASDA